MKDSSRIGRHGTPNATSCDIHSSPVDFVTTAARGGQLLSVMCRASLGVVTAGVLALASLARAQTPATVNVSVDATAAGTPLERVWPFHGYDEINYTTTPEGEALLGDHRRRAHAHRCTCAVTSFSTPATAPRR